MEHAPSLALMDVDSGFIQVVRARLDASGARYRVLGGPVPVETLISMRLDVLIVDPVVFGHRSAEQLAHLCQRIPTLGILVVTGPSSVAQRIRGLRAGIDDWLTKPCHPDEVVARAEAIVRRRRRDALTTEAVNTGEVEVRPELFQAYANDHSLDLTRREFELLHWFTTVQGQVIPREDIYEAVWGYAMASGDRSVDVFIRKLRAKLDEASPGWTYLHTHFGVGYRFEPEER
jgi:DNA-binding response OmpR family regulator